MARPTKQGIDYFPLDVDFDDKTQLYLLEKGGIGLAVLVTAWQLIYSGEGYYIDHTDDLCLLIKRRIDVDANEVSDCINACLRRNLFDKAAHDKHKILTSKALQTRYFDAAKKKKSIKVIHSFLLIDVSGYQNLVSGDGNPVNSGGNATKEKEKEKEEVKVKVNDGGNPPPRSPLTAPIKAAADFQSRRKLIPEDFRPTDQDLQIFRMKGIPEDFATEQIPEFIAWWDEQQIPRDDWRARFRSHVINQWEKSRANNRTTGSGPNGTKATHATILGEMQRDYADSIDEDENPEDYPRVVPSAFH